MLVLVNEWRVKQGPYIPHLILFDIVFRPTRRESNKEVNEKGTRFRDKVVKKLKLGGNRVGNFMPMSEDDGAIYDTYAFCMIKCSLSSKTRMETFIRKNIEDGDLISFR